MTRILLLIELMGQPVYDGVLMLAYTWLASSSHSSSFAAS